MRTAANPSALAGAIEKAGRSGEPTTTHAGSRVRCVGAAGLCGCPGDGGKRRLGNSGPRPSMIERLRLPRPQIATKLYGAIALILAVVYVLAGAATHFAGHARKKRRGGCGGTAVAAVILAGDLEVALEQQRRLVTTAPFVSDQATRRQDERTFADLTTQIPGAGSGDWAERFFAASSPSAPPIWRSWARWSWRSCATSGCIQASAASCQYAPVMRKQRPGGRAPAAIPRGRSGAGEYRLQLAHAHHLGMRGRRGERTADRSHRPPPAAPGAVAPARHRHGARPPRPQRHLDRYPGTAS